MNAHPRDDDGLPGTVYVLHFDPTATPATTSAGPPATSTRAYRRTCRAPAHR